MFASATLVGLSAGCLIFSEIHKNRATDLKDAMKMRKPSGAAESSYGTFTGTLSSTGVETFEHMGIKHRVCGVSSEVVEIMEEKTEKIDTNTGRVMSKTTKRSQDVLDRSEKRFFGNLSLVEDGIVSCEVDQSFHKLIPFEEIASSFRPGFGTEVDMVRKKGERRSDGTRLSKDTIIKKSKRVNGAKTTYLGIKEGTKLTVVGSLKVVGPATYSIAPAPGRYNIVSHQSIESMISDSEAASEACRYAGVGSGLLGVLLHFYPPSQ